MAPRGNGVITGLLVLMLCHFDLGHTIQATGMLLLTESFTIGFLVTEECNQENSHPCRLPG